MVKAKTSWGYTVLEVLVVIAVVAVLAGLSFNVMSDSWARGRDTERSSDIDAIHSRLEEYYSDHGGYPSTLSASLLYDLDPEILKDPGGDTITISTAQTDWQAASNVTSPDGSGGDYLYVPYPTDCNSINCTGYILKSYIEKPTPATPNPYAKSGINNN